MSFTSFEFALFFAAVVIARACVPTLRAEKWLLLAASLAFYMTWSVPCVLLILFTSLSDYTIGRQMGPDIRGAAAPPPVVGEPCDQPWLASIL